MRIFTGLLSSLISLLAKFKGKKSWLWLALCVLAIIAAVIFSGCFGPPSLPGPPGPP